MKECQKCGLSQCCDYAYEGCVYCLEADNKALKERIAELEELLKDIHADLLMRAEYAEDGALCAGLSNSIWARLKRAALRGEQ